MKINKLIVGTLAASLLFTSCAGNFTATSKVHKWNNTLSEPVKSLVFWGMIVVPIYPLCFVGDWFIFNTVEHWTGSNPIAMQDGEIEKEVVTIDGQEYEMIASKNQIKVTPLNTIVEQKSKLFVYNVEKNIWEVSEV